MKNPEKSLSSSIEQQKNPEEIKELSISGVWNKFEKIFTSGIQSGKEILNILEESVTPDEENVLFIEARKIVDFYNSEINRTKDDARSEVASILGQTHEVIEHIPSSRLRSFALYNIPREIEKLMDEDERKKYEKYINLEHIKENSKEWKTYLADKIKENDVVLLGECHTFEGIEKKLFFEYLDKAKEKGVTDIGFEVEERFQEYFDRFMETGKFSETDDPKDYKKASEYQRLRLEWHRRHDEKSLKEYASFEVDHADNFLFSRHRFDEFYAMLQKARELGLKVHCIDGNYSDLSEDDFQGNNAQWEELEQPRLSERDERMYKNIKEAVADKNRKILIILGSNHVGRGGAKYKNLSDKLTEDSTIKSFRINIDRNLDEDVTMQGTKKDLNLFLKKDIHLNSILYNFLEKQDIKEIGFDLNSSLFVPKYKQKEIFAYDGYIKI